MNAKISTQRHGRAGVITLNRPRTLNALDREMVGCLRCALDRFEQDDLVETVVLRSAVPKAFSAGGDMRVVRQLCLAGKYAEAEAFFEEEYLLNAQIASYPKPYVSLIDGICMGGGMGISIHGTFRIATERAVLAMPETAIGFVPDVGSSFFLSHLPDHAGRWLGLTGAQINGEEALALGLATHVIFSDKLPGLLDNLASGTMPVEATLDAASHQPPIEKYLVDFARLGDWFAAPKLSDIRDRLMGSRALRAETALKALTTASPHSLAETMILIDLGAGSEIETCLARELETVKRVIRHPDLVEGVRAVLIDKDRMASWGSR